MPKNTIRYKFTSEYLEHILGTPGRIYALDWDQVHEILTVFCECDKYGVAEGQATPSGDALELTPYDLTSEEVRQIIQEYKEKKNEVPKD